jgi:hypothetical protein
MEVNDIRVFVPSKDYEISKEFYQALGFRMQYVSEELSIFECGACIFFLQNFCNQELAKNLMLQLIVADIGDALEIISNIKTKGIRYEPIVKEHWGQVIYLWGPSGELWHVTQLAN